MLQNNEHLLPVSLKEQGHLPGVNKLEKLHANINSENNKVKQLQNEIRKLKFIIQTKECQIRKLNEKEIETGYENAKADTFSHKILKQKPKKIQYLCGLSVEQFDILIHCLMPCSHIINYPECKCNGVRILDKPTELLSVMTVCLHRLNNEIVA